MIAILLWTMLLCALVPAVMFCVNLRMYAEPPIVRDGAALPAVSILIPARNEAAAIESAVRHALATRDVAFEVIVMDDGSSDGTDALVLKLAADDARVRLERAPALPGGWNGKQHACWALAHKARSPVLCFVDADVTLGPECVGRMASFLVHGDNGLVSGFPQQVTGTWLEWLLLPLIHFVLLGFLPIARLRRGTAASAQRCMMGCYCRGCFGLRGFGRIWRILRIWQAAACIRRRRRFGAGWRKMLRKGLRVREGFFRLRWCCCWGRFCRCCW